MTHHLLKPGLPPLAPAALALSAGILAARAGPDLPLFLIPSLGILFILFVSFYLYPLKRFSLLLCIALLLTGFFTMSERMSPDLPETHISSFADGKVRQITGRIDSFARHYPGKTRVTIQCLTIGNPEGGEQLKTSGHILLSIYRAGEASIPPVGAIISFTARIRPIRNFANPGGYDYKLHMQFKQIFGSAHVGFNRIKVQESDKTGIRVAGFQRMESLRNRFSHFLARNVENTRTTTEDKLRLRRYSAAVLNAMITGKKEAMTPELRDMFARAGASHLLAISGLHMSILAFGLYQIFYLILNRFHRLSVSGAAKKLAGLLTLGPLVGYALFSGFSPSTQRAFIMTLVFMAAILSEKENDPMNTLCLAAVAILALDPPALFSISFQLSFAALGFILLGFRALSRYALPRQNRFLAYVTGAVLVTLFAGLGTFPLIARYFNMVSYIQILSNLVLIPVMGFACLPLGFLALLTMDLFPGMAAGIIDLGLELMDTSIMFIHMLANWNFSWSRMITLTWIEVGLVYIFLSGLLFLAFRKKNVAVYCLTLALAGGAVCTGLGIKQRYYPDELTATVIDCGQGSAAMVHTAEGKIILLDGGGFSGQSAFDIGRYIVAPFLWKQRIKTIDAVILSHPEADHMNGLLFILNNFSVRQWIRNSDIADSRTFSALVRTADSREIPQMVLEKTPLIQNFGQAEITIYPRRFMTGHSNNDSLVTRLRYRNVSMLFPGDIEAEREEDMVKTYSSSIKSTLMTAPHHGSRGSSTNIFLDIIAPESVIVSCGYMNRYQLPHKETLERYREKNIRVYRTDLHGAVSITTDGKSYQINTHRGN
ncbi:MAG: DNA internalization-related competence protein ComEC/Rec2 [Desulfobacterales bacterium]|nr:DNA internalization-related competence protein ComEC/Rec2 [Desulfobacterales bacterium]